MVKRKYDHSLVVAKYQELGSGRKVARALGMDNNTVNKILSQHGIHQGRGRNNALPLPTQEIVDRYLAGESTLQIAQDFHVGDECIRERLIKSGIPRRPYIESNSKPGEKNQQYRGSTRKSKPDTHHQLHKEIETVLGEKLPRGTIVHHFDEDTENNALDNLWVFPDDPSHLRYHQRLLRLQRKETTEDAIQAALESNGLPLRQFLFQRLCADGKGQLDPSRMVPLPERFLTKYIPRQERSRRLRAKHPPR